MGTPYTYISDIVNFLVTLMNGDNQYISGKLWQQIATSVTVNIGQATSTLDPLNLGNAVLVNSGGGCTTPCECSWGSFYCCWGAGASGYAGIDIIQGIANAVADEKGTTVEYSCFSDTTGAIIIVIPVSTTATATSNFGFTAGMGVGPCIVGNYTEFPVSTITVNVIISIPYSVVQFPNLPTTQSLLLDMSQCTLQVGSVSNMSFVQDVEDALRAFMEGATVGIFAINALWNATFAPLFVELNTFLYDKINNNALNKIPSNVISNVIPAAFSKLLMPLTGNPCDSEKLMARYNFVTRQLKINNERVNQMIEQNKQKDELNRKKQNDRNRLSFQQSGINYPAHHYKSCCK